MNKFSLLMTGAALISPMVMSAENMALELPERTPSNQGNAPNGYVAVEMPSKVAFADLDNPNSMTMSAWIMLRDVEREQDDFQIFGQRSQEHAVFEQYAAVYVRSNANGVLSIAGNDITAGANNCPALENGEWHNVTLTYDKDASSFALYLDGVLVQSAEAAATWTPNKDVVTFYSGDYAFGNAVFVGGGYTPGLTVDQFSVYNRCLSDEDELNAAMIMPEAVEGLTALYTFNEVKDGTTVTFANCATGDAAMTDVDAYVHFIICNEYSGGYKPWNRILTLINDGNFNLVPGSEYGVEGGNGGTTPEPPVDPEPPVVDPPTPIFENGAVTVTHAEKGHDSQRIELSDLILGKDKAGKAFTMSSWVKVDNYTIPYGSTNCGDKVNTKTAMVMGHRARCHDNLNASFWMGYSDEGVLHLTGKPLASNDACITTDSKIELGEWTYLTVTCTEDGVWTLYKNGEAIGTSTYALKAGDYFGDTDKADENFNGTIYFVGGQNFNGAVDEFQFWTRALSADEVVSAMENAAAVEGIAGLYTYDVCNTDGYFDNQVEGDFISGFFQHSYSGSYMTEGGPDTMVTRPAPAEPTFVEGRVIKQEYCNPYEGLKNSRSDRYMTGIALKDSRGNEGALTNLSTSAGQPLYTDMKENVIGTFVAGEKVTVTTTGAGEWMHRFLFVDWNNDGVFSTDNIVDGAPQAGAELVTHEGITYTDPGGNKGGWFTVEGKEINEPAGGYKGELPAFTIPADTKPGVYTARMRVAWDVFDPCSLTSQAKNGQTMVEQGGLVIDFRFEVKKDAHAMRTITIGAEDPTLGTVEFVGVEVEGNQLTTTDDVTVKATATDANAYFVCWNNQNGDLVTTEEEYTYKGEEDIELVAVFQQHFTVNFEGVKVANVAGAITSGALIDKGVELTVTPIVPEGKVFAKLIVNEVDVTEQMTDGVYVFEVAGETNISVELADLMVTLAIKAEGKGKVVVATANEEGVPAGDIIADGSQLPYNTELYFFIYPEENQEVVSVTYNGDDWTSELETVTDGFMFCDMAYQEECVLEVKFTANEDPNSIELVEAEEATAEYFNLQGVRVERSNLVPGVYVRRAGDKVSKVIVK